MALSTSQAKAVTTFNFDVGGLNGLSTVNLTADSISLTTFDFVSATNLSKADSGGLCFAGNSNDSNALGFCQLQSSFKLQFNKPVKLISYIAGYNTYSDNLPPFNIASLTFSQTISSSIQSGFQEEEIELLNNQFVASANIPVLVTNNFENSSFGDNKSYLQLLSLTVEEVPGPLSFMGAAFAFGYSRKLRQRISVSRPGVLIRRAKLSPGFQVS